MPNIDTSNNDIESREVPKFALRVFFLIVSLLTLIEIGALVFYSYVFASIIAGDPTFKDLLSVYTMHMETAIPYAKLYLGFTLTILSLFIFQLTTCVTAFKCQINHCFIYPFWATLLINLILSVVYFFMADWRIRFIPLTTFWTTMAMINCFGKLS